MPRSLPLWAWPWTRRGRRRLVDRLGQQVAAEEGVDLRAARPAGCRARASSAAGRCDTSAPSQAAIAAPRLSATPRRWRGRRPSSPFAELAHARPGEPAAEAPWPRRRPPAAADLERRRSPSSTPTPADARTAIPRLLARRGSRGCRAPRGPARGRPRPGPGRLGLLGRPGVGRSPASSSRSAWSATRSNPASSRRSSPARRRRGRRPAPRCAGPISRALRLPRCRVPARHHLDVVDDLRPRRQLARDHPHGVVGRTDDTPPPTTVDRSRTRPTPARMWPNRCAGARPCTAAWRTSHGPLVWIRGPTADLITASSRGIGATRPPFRRRVHPACDPPRTQPPVPAPPPCSRRGGRTFNGGEAPL